MVAAIGWRTNVAALALMDTRQRALLLAGISIGLAGAVLVLMIVVDWPHF